MDPNILKEKVALAKSAVEGLEEPLKSEGFKTVLSKLLEERSDNKKGGEIVKKIEHTSRSNKEQKDLLVINRTKYTQIYGLKKVLEKALFILRIYRDDKHIDGLTPSQISKTLTDVFRIKTSLPAVSMALINAKSEVDRTSKVLSGGGKTYVYKLMSGGENLLKQKLQNES